MLFWYDFYNFWLKEKLSQLRSMCQSVTECIVKSKKKKKTRYKTPGIVRILRLLSSNKRVFIVCEVLKKKDTLFWCLRFPVFDYLTSI